MKNTNKIILEQAEAEVNLAHEDSISQKRRSVHFKKAADLYRKAGDNKKYNECMGWFHMTDIKKNDKNGVAKIGKAALSLKKSGKTNQYHSINGLYFERKAGQEKDIKKKAELYKKSHDEYSLIKKASKEEIKIEGNIFEQAQKEKTKSLALHYENMAAYLLDKRDKKNHLQNTIKAAEYFKLASVEYKNLKDNKKAQSCLGLHHLFVSFGQKTREQGLINLKQSWECLQSSGQKDPALKAKSAYLRVLSLVQPSKEKALKCINSAIDAIKKTSDKYALNEFLGFREEYKARKESNPDKKSKLFLKASEYYSKDGLEEQKLLCEARSKLVLVHKENLSLDEITNLYKDASQLLNRTQDKIFYFRTRGHYFLMRAIKEGMVKDDSEKFVKYQLDASKEFRKGKMYDQASLYTGLAFLIISRHLTYPKNLEVMGFASDQFYNVGNILLYDLSQYFYFSILAENDETAELKNDYKKRSLLHLKSYVTREKPKFESKGKEELLNFNPMLLAGLYEAEMYKLEADLESEQAKKVDLDRKAIEIFDKILKHGNDKDRLMAFRGKGWLLRDRRKFVESVEVLKKGIKELTDNSSLIKELDSVNKLLVEDYKQSKEDLEIEKKLRLEYQNQLINNKYSNLEPIGSGDNQGQGNFEEFALSNLIKSGLILEEFKTTYKKNGKIILDEPGFRDQMLMLLKQNIQIGELATRETMHGNGKTDIRIAKNVSGDEIAISECLIWHGVKYYLGKKSQLMGYVTRKERYCFLITFSDTKDFSSIIKNAKDEILKEDDYIKDSIEQLNSKEGQKLEFFSSLHKIKSGTLKIYHLFFDLN